MYVQHNIKMTKQMKDTMEIGLINGGAIGISLGQVNEILTLISLLVAISYTIYKFIKLKE
tara:strand:- start:349 stop:528 length:180 start_codon:yes stop_codon:yes gene_type:complete